MPLVLKKKSAWILFAGLVILVWVGLVVYRGFTESGESDQYKTLAEGEILPENTPVLTMQGKLAQMADYRGKVVLLNFWAAWCGPCLKEMPSLYKLHESLKDKGFVVLAISMDDDLGQGVETLKRIAGAPPFAVIKGTEQAIYHRFPIEGLPYTVVLDKTGVIHYARPGERDWMRPEARKIIEDLL
jgi:thiol-disulfide isomerase/thioredoxin